ncbi:MAG: hypothetical protein LUF35_00570 [Lachnospiraceae bacterium]|nr:hypothetical protein [Lachnospiraceae bacterium]
MDEISQIFDKVFKRIFTFSDKAITNLINGLFGTNYPPDSQIEYSNRENTRTDLSHTYSDLFIIINRKWHYMSILNPCRITKRNPDVWIL